MSLDRRAMPFSPSEISSSPSSLDGGRLLSSPDDGLLLSESSITGGSSASSPFASTFSGNSDSVITRTRTQVRRRLPTFFSDIKKSSFFCLYGAKKGGGNLHLATGCRAARAPFRSVALRHRLSPAVPFSVQLLFCEPHRYLCLPIFYVHSIPDLPKNARRFSKNI